MEIAENIVPMTLAQWHLQFAAWSHREHCMVIQKPLELNAQLNFARFQNAMDYGRISYHATDREIDDFQTSIIAKNMESNITDLYIKAFFETNLSFYKSQNTQDKYGYYSVLWSW